MHWYWQNLAWDCYTPFFWKLVTHDSIISSSFMDMQGLHNWIKNWTLSAVQFFTFPMWSKRWSSTVPALDPWCAANFGLKYRKRFESCLFLSGHLAVIAISPCQFRLAIRFFLISLSHHCFGAFFVLHLSDQVLPWLRQYYPPCGQIGSLACST